MKQEIEPSIPTDENEKTSESPRDMTSMGTKLREALNSVPVIGEFVELSLLNKTLLISSSIIGGSALHGAIGHKNWEDFILVGCSFMAVYCIIRSKQ